MDDTYDINAFLESWLSVPVDEWNARINEWAYQFRDIREGSNQVRRGGVQSSQARLGASDKFKAQFRAAKPTNEFNTPIADGSAVEVISDNWTKFGLLMTQGINIHPGTDAKIELHLDGKVSVRIKQRFLIRLGTTVVGGGLFTQVLPPQAEEEKKKLLEAKLQKLEVNPCKNPTKKQGESGCSHSNNDKDHKTAEASNEFEDE